jgi:Short-chain dehydrogenases of various substrate specificities
MEIKGRHVVITGANRGIGRAVALMCAQDKANLHLVVRKEDKELQSEMEAAGAKSVTIYKADLSTKKGIESLLESLSEVSVDILFNNAGMLTGGLIEEQPIDDIYKMFQVNINALVHMTHGILPGMLKRKRGKIINNSSVSAYMHFPSASTYAASKAAVAAFTDCLRAEVKDTNITTLLLVTPGIKTRMFDEIETLYSKNFDVPQQAMSPSKYAEVIREAILHDLEVVKPSGITGFGLKIARFLPPLFEMGVQRKFKR